MREIKINDSVKLMLAEITVEEIFEKEFDNDGKKVVSTSAHVKQERVMCYPSKNMGTGHGDGLFDNPVGNEYPSERHTLVAVPEGSDTNAVKGQIGKFKESCIFRILSNDIMDVIGTKNKAALDNSQTDLDILKARYVVRDGEGTIYATHLEDGTELGENERAIGTIVSDDDGKVIGMNITNKNALLEYKVDVFSREFRKDEDKRQFVKKGTADEVVEESSSITA
jgi:uncharacterized protein YuzE